MAELTLTALVTRTELSLAALDIDDGTNFILGKGLDAGTVSWRKEVVTSPFYAGRVPVHEVKDSVEMTLVVYILGATHATLMTNLQTLLNAFTEQSTYEVQLTIEGQSYHWTCERADYQVGFATETLNARYIPVSLSFHRHPEPAAGVL